MRAAYWDDATSAVVDVSELPDGRHFVNRVFTPPSNRRRGGATAAMRATVEDADAESTTLQLYINPYGDMGYDDLASFYESNGFVSDDRGVFTREPSP